MYSINRCGIWRQGYLLRHLQESHYGNPKKESSTQLLDMSNEKCNRFP